MDPQPLCALEPHSGSNAHGAQRRNHTTSALAPQLGEKTTTVSVHFLRPPFFPAGADSLQPTHALFNFI